MGSCFYFCFNFVFLFFPLWLHYTTAVWHRSSVRIGAPFYCSIPCAQKVTTNKQLLNRQLCVT